jgi:hypothetical protein
LSGGQASAGLEEPGTGEAICCCCCCCIEGDWRVREGWEGPAAGAPALRGPVAASAPWLKADRAALGEDHAALLPPSLGLPMATAGACEGPSFEFERGGKGIGGGLPTAADAAPRRRDRGCEGGCCGSIMGETGMPLLLLPPLPPRGPVGPCADASREVLRMLCACACVCVCGRGGGRRGMSVQGKGAGQGGGGLGPIRGCAQLRGSPSTRSMSAHIAYITHTHIQMHTHTYTHTHTSTPNMPSAGGADMGIPKDTVGLDPASEDPGGSMPSAARSGSSGEGGSEPVGGCRGLKLEKAEGSQRAEDEEGGRGGVWVGYKGVGTWSCCKL